MRRSISAILTLAALAGCAQLEPAPYELTAEQVRPYVEFVERETGYSLSPLPVVTSDMGRMRAAFGRSMFAQMPPAAFAIINGVPTIAIESGFFQRAPGYFGAAMVHELTHHGQFLAYEAAKARGEERAIRVMKGWECGASTEREAHAVELRWATQHDPSIRNRVASVNVSAYSACQRGYEADIFSSSRATLSVANKP